MRSRKQSRSKTRLLAVSLLVFLGAATALRITTGLSHAGLLPAILPTAPTIDHMPSSGSWTYNFSDYPDGLPPKADWNIEAGPKVPNFSSEDQDYSARTDNVRIENGVLVIEAKPETRDGKNYTSARINTLGKFDFNYGTLEVDMMVPRGAGTWPAAWLMPATNTYHPGQFGIANSDPYAWVLNGEIDFEEQIGRLPGQNIPAAHSYNSRKSQASQYTPAYIAGPYDEYHRYGIIKTPDKITFTVDGIPYATREKSSTSPLDWPYDQHYYLILNLAMGGQWAGADGIDASTAPWELKIKSISYKPL